MKFYYLDRHIAVCEKESGLLSEGDAKDSMPTLLKEALAEKGEATDIFPVHRLDRETEGIMVYARTKEAAAALSREILDGTFKKEYVARVHGTPEPSSGTMEDLLFYDRTKNRSFPVKRERKGVKRASLDYETLSTDESNKTSLVRIRLHTGRTHQIRVQFSSRKMPIVGDRKYGAPPSDAPMRLRACMLELLHPETGKIMRFEKV